MIGQRFHDDDYDGIVLKLNNGFLLTNPDLKPALEAFEKALNDCEYSMYMPDHQMNLYELKNRDRKMEIIKSKRQEEKDALQSRMERHNKLGNREILPITTVKYAYGVNVDYKGFIIGDKTFHEEDIFTEKGNLKAPFKEATKSFLKECNTFEFIGFLKKNGIRDIDDEHYDVAMLNPVATTITVD